MKRILFLFATLPLTILLTSCEVNLGNRTADVPWYYIAIPVVLISILGYLILMNMTFVCPNCKTEFKPKWYHLSVMMHMGRKRYVICPMCKSRGYFARKK